MSLQTVFLVGGYKKEKSIPLDSGSWGPLLWVPRREKETHSLTHAEKEKIIQEAAELRAREGRREMEGCRLKCSLRFEPRPPTAAAPSPHCKRRKEKKVHFQIIGLAGQEDGVWTSGGGGGGGRAVDEHWSIFPLLPPDPYPHAWNEERKLGKERKAIDTTYYFAQT